MARTMHSYCAYSSEFDLDEGSLQAFFSIDPCPIFISAVSAFVASN